MANSSRRTPWSISKLCIFRKLGYTLINGAWKGTYTLIIKFLITIDWGIQQPFHALYRLTFYSFWCHVLQVIGPFITCSELSQKNYPQLANNIEILCFKDSYKIINDTRYYLNDGKSGMANWFYFYLHVYSKANNFASRIGIRIPRSLSYRLALLKNKLTRLATISAQSKMEYFLVCIPLLDDVFLVFKKLSKCVKMHILHKATV